MNLDYSSGDPRERQMRNAQLLRESGTVEQRADAVEAFRAEAVRLYPAALRKWQEWNKVHPPSSEMLAQVPWLPYMPSIETPDNIPHGTKFIWRLTDTPYPSPGPGGFKFGNRGGFDNSPRLFFQTDDWRPLLPPSIEPGTEFLSALIKRPNNRDEDDYMRVLWIRAGDWWRPLAAYASRISSSFVEFRDEMLKPAVAMALSIGGGAALAAQIGPAIMGPTFAAANPGITAALGNTVLGTILNGGDLGAAVKNVALSFAGGYAGSQLGALADSQLVAKVSTAALTAALKGGDVRMAVAQSLASTGFQNLGQTLTAPTVAAQALTEAPAPVPIQPEGELQMAIASADYFDPVYTEDALPPPGNSWEAFDWSAPVDPQYASWIDKIEFNPTGMDGPIATTSAPPAPSVPAASDSNWIADVTNVALAAIKLNAAYKASKQPEPRTATQAGGYTYTPNANGTVTVRNPSTGQVAVQRPQAGIPYVLADGRIIINNGNGTYDVTYPDGSKQTVAYAPTQSGGTAITDSLAKIPPVAWGLGAAALMLLLRRRRR